MEPFCEQSEQNVSRAGLSEGQWERVIVEEWKTELDLPAALGPGRVCENVFTY